MSDDLILFITVGFVAQMVDGAIGMAYGLTATTVLLGTGVSPAVASACVHAAEVFTTGASGLSHWRLGNIDRRLVLRLMVPGMVGGAIGAYVLTSLPGDLLRPWIAGYLLILGGVILWKALRPRPLEVSPPRHVGVLGFFGGMLDAIGGGGWGPMVASTLLGAGGAPRTTIGSVNIAEFFVTLVISATLIGALGTLPWEIFAGLVIGGVIAAPFAALATKHLPNKALMVLVGGVVVLLSSRSLIMALP